MHSPTPQGLLCAISCQSLSPGFQLQLFFFGLLLGCPEIGLSGWRLQMLCSLRNPRKVHFWAGMWAQQGMLVGHSLGDPAWRAGVARTGSNWLGLFCLRCSSVAWEDLVVMLIWIVLHLSLVLPFCLPGKDRFRPSREYGPKTHLPFFGAILGQFFPIFPVGPPSFATKLSSLVTDYRLGIQAKHRTGKSKCTTRD